MSESRALAALMDSGSHFREACLLVSLASPLLLCVYALVTLDTFSLNLFICDCVYVCLYVSTEPGVVRFHGDEIVASYKLPNVRTKLGSSSGAVHALNS